MKLVKDGPEIAREIVVSQPPATWVVPPDLGPGLLDNVNTFERHLREVLKDQPREQRMVRLLAEIARRGVPASKEEP